MTTTELKQYIDKVLGNSIRCLLPSYWWKRLFHQVADRIDDKQDILVSGKNIKTINGNSLLGEGDTNVDIIINSVDELNALDLPTGSRASVVTGGPVLGSIKDCVAANDVTQFTRVSGVQINAFPDFSLLPSDANDWGIYFYEGTSPSIFIVAKKDESVMGATRISTSETIFLSRNGVDISQDAVNRINEWFKTGDYKVAVYDGHHDLSDFYDSFIKFYIYHPTISDVYIKADSWERLAKEEDAEIPIVVSEDDLKNLDVKNGSLASVLGYDTKERSFRELHQISIDDYINENFSKCTEVEDIIIKSPNIGNEIIEWAFVTADSSRTLLFVAEGNNVSCRIGIENNSDTTEWPLYASGQYIQSGHNRIQEELSSYKYRFVYSNNNSNDISGREINTSATYDILDTFATCVATLPTANVYVKGNTWEKLAKENAVQNKVIKAYVDEAITSAITNTLNTPV